MYRGSITALAALGCMASTALAQQGDALDRAVRAALEQQMPGETMMINCLASYFDPLTPDQRDLFADFVAQMEADPAAEPPQAVLDIWAELPPEEAYYEACRDAVDSVGAMPDAAPSPDAPSPAGAGSTWPQDDVGLIAVNRQGSIEEFLMRAMGMELEAQFRTPFHVRGQGGPNNPMGFVNFQMVPPDGAQLGQLIPLAHFGLSGGPAFTAADFTAIAQFAFEPTTIHVAAESPIADIAGLVEALRTDAGSLSISCGGPCFGGWDVPFVQMLIAEGVDAGGLDLVPDRAFGEGLAKLAAGEVDVVLGSIRTASVIAEPGTVRALAVMDAAPMPFDPSAPPVQEGLGTAYVGGMWYGIGAGPGMDPALVAEIEAGIRRVTEQESYRAQMEAVGVTVRFLGHEAFTDRFAQHFTAAQAVFDATNVP